MMLITVENFEINPEEVGGVYEGPPTDPTRTRRTVMLVQGVELRTNLSVAEVKKLLTEAK